jgi:GxxExxY protein
MGKILFKEESYKIIGACMEVHTQLGPGFLEAVYQEALEIEFNRENIPYKREPELTILYKGVPLTKKYFPDFICYSEIIIELKAVSSLNNDLIAQTVNYLKATNFELALLVNFGETSLIYERLVRYKSYKKTS